MTDTAILKDEKLLTFFIVLQNDTLHKFGDKTDKIARVNV